MANTIKIKRGLESDLPTLSEGELALTTDTGSLFAGTGVGNVALTGGGIIETGQNSYGKWVRYKNGLLIQWGAALVNVEMKTSLGGTGFYRTSTYQTFTFPKAYTSEPSVQLTPRAAISIAYTTEVSTTTVKFYPCASYSADATNRVVYWIAIGY